MADLIRSHDWSQTPLGPIDHWPQSLRTAANLMLNARQPMWIGWGPSATFLYNDAYIPVLSLAKHPWALGKPAAVVWEEIWDFCGPLTDKVFNQGEASFVDAVRLFMNRGDFLEETFYSFSYSPIRNELGQVAGLFCPNTEVTAQHLNTRRLATLSVLAANALVEKTTQAACESVAQTLARNPDDIPFALLYRTYADEHQLQLEQAVHLPAGDVRLSPSVVGLDGATPGPLNLPLADVLTQGKMAVGTWTDATGLPLGLVGQPVTRAVVLPLIAPGQEQPIGVLVAGINPARQLDIDYQTFFELVANQVATAIQNAHTAQEERQRLDQLAELNRAKTLFFSNISHEFRTPLTLMLGPLDELLRGSDPLMTESQRIHAEAAHRNASRLLRLVNTLLDFSRLESGRLQASFAPTDLATLTTDLTSSFRSIIEKAGMQLVVATEPLAGPVAVDPVMWEKIVLNLLSNAFKFTLSGTITVHLAQTGEQVTLTVQDTGVGIPPTDLPRLFERFYRVEGAQGRSFEGSGIGLALVSELVGLHGGTISVRSELGVGSTFTVQLPTHQAIITPTYDQPTLTTDLFLADAESILVATPDSQLSTETSKPAPAQSGTSRKRVLLADDNADMRAYIHRLLSPHYDVDVVADGREALAAIQREMPDLLVSDIMMPHIDGTELVKNLKANPQTAHLPVMLLSARAGEEATRDGYTAGADDYLTKPFSANELLIRVRAQLQLAQTRQENQQQLRHLFKQAPVAIAIMEREPDFIYRLANTAYAELVDRPLEAIIGQPLLAVLPEIDGQGFDKLLTQVMTTGIPFVAREAPISLTLQGISKSLFLDYIYHPMRDPGGEVNSVMSVVIDVTEQVTARQAIEASQRQFQQLTDLVPQILWTARPDGSVDYFNQPWYDYTGFAKAEENQTWLPILHPDDVPTALATWANSIRTGDPYQIEYRFADRRHPGQYRWFMGRAIPVRAETPDGRPGPITKWFGSCSDIHESKLASEVLERRVAERTGELRSLNTDLERSNFDLMQFASVASHDLKEPLRKVQAFSNLLLVSLEEKLDEDERAHFDRIIRAAARMQNLIDDVLRLSKLSKVDARYEPVDLTATINQIKEDLEIAIQEKNAVVQTETLPIINAIPGQMHQLFQNLISNALKFTANRRPVVTIETSPITDQLRTEFGLADGQYVAICVRDNGIGFEMQYVDKIFGMFQRLHRRDHYEGTGIGLTICRRIVENHHGYIIAEGVPNQGASFQLILPVNYQQRTEAN